MSSRTCAPLPAARSTRCDATCVTSPAKDAASINCGTYKASGKKPSGNGATYPGVRRTSKEQWAARSESGPYLPLGNGKQYGSTWGPDRAQPLTQIIGSRRATDRASPASTVARTTALTSL